MQLVVSRVGTRRSLPGRMFRAVLAVGCLVVVGAALVGACGSSDVDTCVGGFVGHGVCEPKCKPELCLEGNTCVDNRCVLLCDGHTDCFPGTQECASAKEDDTEKDVLVCTGHGKAAGIGDGCPFEGQCDLLASCPDGSSCNLGQCEGKPETCVLDAAVCGADKSCTAGRCPDGSPCDVPTCPLSECTPLTCVTTGEGDADAYCTRPDCTVDADCPGGYECGVVRDPHEICNSNPKKGNNGLCGETREACIDPSSFGKGNSYFEGSLCLLRKVCLKRSQCAPCETDLDCSRVDGQLCVQVGDEKRCARSCRSDLDCDLDYACDTDTGACIPLFGRCKGEGNLCEPCRNDTDCGDATTAKVCFQAPLGHQLGCLDLSIRCTTVDDCPEAPSGHRGSCTTDGQCLFPSIDEKTSCW
jgi:hypothetical protein